MCRKRHRVLARGGELSVSPHVLLSFVVWLLCFCGMCCDPFTLFVCLHVSPWLSKVLAPISAFTQDASCQLAQW